MTYSANHNANPSDGIGPRDGVRATRSLDEEQKQPPIGKNLERGVSGPGHNSITMSPDGRELFMVYHAHADVNCPSGIRTVNIDRPAFDDQGRLRLLGPTRTPQPLPSGAR